eukprot:15444964-Alexandrium_andersonii.AAC.1
MQGPEGRCGTARQFGKPCICARAIRTMGTELLFAHAGAHVSEHRTASARSQSGASEPRLRAANPTLFKHMS